MIPYETEILIGLIGFSVLLMIGIFTLWRRASSLNKRLDLFVSRTGVADLERLLLDLKMHLERVEEKVDASQPRIEKLEQTIREVRGKTGIVRYQAFAGQGNDLSFSLAVLNDKQDGYVLSGIHTREDSYVYATPLRGGESPYHLSPEEKEAIRQALNAE